MRLLYLSHLLLCVAVLALTARGTLTPRHRTALLFTVLALVLALWSAPWMH